MLSSLEIALCIHTQEDEKQDGESPQGGTAVAEKRQRDTYDRSKAKHHAYIDEKMEKENAQNRVSINSAKSVRLAFSQCYQSPDEQKID